MIRDNETWIIEAGDAVIGQRHSHGTESLSSLDRLIYCLWVADYGMRNAGDLETAQDLYELFQQEGARLAKELALPRTLAAFALSRSDLETRYFDVFDAICAEIRATSATP